MTQPTIADYAAPAPHSIRVDRTLADAHRLMRANRIRHLPVLDGSRLVGLVSQRDLYFLETIQGVDPEKVPVEEAMSQGPYVVSRAASLRSVVLHMWKNKVGSAVVMEHDQVVGLFTSTDALHALVELLAHQPKPAPRRSPATRRAASKQTPR